MRVIAGALRGRKLVAPVGNAVRPTSDRVREAIFNALYSLGGVEGVTVLDLFAGTGALGIEALSRGAASAVFVEADREAHGIVEENLAALGLTDRATVVRSDAMTYLGTHRGRSGGAVDVAFCDPPYDFDAWSELLDAVDAGRVVVESGRSLPDHPQWSLDREKAYGATVVTIMSRPTTSGETSP